MTWNSLRFHLLDKPAIKLSFGEESSKLQQTILWKFKIATHYFVKVQTILWKFKIATNYFVKVQGNSEQFFWVCGSSKDFVTSWEFLNVHDHLYTFVIICRCLWSFIYVYKGFLIIWRCLWGFLSFDDVYEGLWSFVDVCDHL